VLPPRHNLVAVKTLVTDWLTFGRSSDDAQLQRHVSSMESKWRVSQDRTWGKLVKNHIIGLSLET
jgi:hypothetical protein